MDELDADVRERVDELDCEVFAVIDELPLADVIGKIVNGLDAQVREGTDDLDTDIRKGVDDADSAGQTNPLEIAIRRHGRSGQGGPAETEETERQ